ncbi:hypothetical protein DENSPDRAFT_875232 [Dentipellis sp. KUC8613]|nr:hypothetical protein DENSPDRAFT_875232 [Dentipellis sp. KUC8613]
MSPIPTSPSSSSSYISSSPPPSPTFDTCSLRSACKNNIYPSSPSGSFGSLSEHDEWMKPNTGKDSLSSSTSSLSSPTSTWNSSTPSASSRTSPSIHKAAPLPLVAEPPACPTLARLPLDPALQAYYFRMRQASIRTIHPARITTEAQRLAERVAKGTTTINAAAQLLFYAGISRIETCRSASVLVQDTATQLLWRTNWATRTALVRELENVVYAAFVMAWTDNSELSAINAGNGVTPLRPLLEAARAQFLNIAAFLGALGGCEIVSSPLLNLAVAALARYPRSIAHCRALHLLLLYAGPSVDTGVLTACADLLTRHAVEDKLFVRDPMARRWVLEICALVGEIRAKEAGAGGDGVWVAKLRWDPYLKCRSLVGLMG